MMAMSQHAEALAAMIPVGIFLSLTVLPLAVLDYLEHRRARRNLGRHVDKVSTKE